MCPFLNVTPYVPNCETLVWSSSYIYDIVVVQYREGVNVHVESLLILYRAPLRCVVLNLLYLSTETHKSFPWSRKKNTYANIYFQIMKPRHALERKNTSSRSQDDTTVGESGYIIIRSTYT